MSGCLDSSTLFFKLQITREIIYFIIAVAIIVFCFFILSNLNELKYLKIKTDFENPENLNHIIDMIEYIN